MQKRIKQTIAGVMMLLMMGGLATYHYNEVKRVENQLLAAKTELLAKDSVMLVHEGQYQKLVNDLNTEKQLTKILKDANKDLSKQVDEGKIKQVIKTVYQPVYQTDTVTQIQYVQGNMYRFRYPENEQWYIQHTLSPLLDSTFVSTWMFQPIEIDIAVAEDSPGIFKATLDGPHWLTVKDLQIDVLKNMEPKQKLRIFKPLVGGGILYSFADHTFIASANGGVRFNKSNFIVSLYSNESAGFHYLREF